MCVLSLVGLAGAGQAAETVSTGSVAVSLRGWRLPDRPVHFPGFLEDAPLASVTDAQGRAMVHPAVGLRRLSVSVPGVGFGSTGTVVARGPDHGCLSAALAAAVPAERGALTALLVPTVDATWRGITPWLAPASLSALSETVMDAVGRFTITGLPAGDRLLSLGGSFGYTRFSAVTPGGQN